MNDESETAATALALGISDKHFRLLVQNVCDDGMVLLNSEGTVMSWNPGAQRITGYKAAEVVGRHMSCLFTAEDYTAGKPDQLLEQASTRGSSRDEGWSPRKDGQRFWAMRMITALRASDRSLLGFAQITHDDSVRHDISEKQRHSEELLRLLVDGLKEHGLYTLSCDGTVSSWNLGAARIHGYQSAEIIGRNFDAFFTVDDRHAGHPGNELQLAALHGMMEEEGWRIRKDGSRFWASIVVSALRSSDGTLRGFAKVTRDESLRHDAFLARTQALERAEAAESQLLGQKSELEARVRERTIELSQQAEHLLRTNAELQQINYIASHDLQEPLRTITAFCSRLSENKQSSFDSEALIDMGLIIDAAKRMQQLILDLLAFGHAQHKASTFVTLPLREALDEAVTNLHAAIAESATTLDIQDLPTVVADRRLMIQLFQNLVGNAIKYRGDASPLVTLSARRTDDAWEISIRDNGIGISPRHRTRVFELFKRLHPANRYSGTGLGLALCKKIVERHRGKLWIESTPSGIGSQFLFTIPDRTQS